MRAMQLEEAGRPLRLVELARPKPGPRQVLLRVRACGVCRTDLHIFDGELDQPALPLVLGHEIVGEVAAIGEEVTGLVIGQRLGVPWLGSSCGGCRFCRTGAENLCERPLFTGYTRDGGYAEYTIADPRFCFPLPDAYRDAEAAPLLCAGLIGYRAYRIAGESERLGLYGFGAAAHILAQIAHHDGREVYAFTRPGDDRSQKFARRLGAVWAGGSDATPPVELDAAILFAPVGALVPAALNAVRRGGTVVCAGIHMSDIPSFPYELLWGERVLRSVANLTREDGIELFRVVPQVPVRTSVQSFLLEQANEALAALRHGELQGAAVLEIG
jgi:propanol-preferring alcohol dehydrogenase